jgi:hypothetical protein
MGDVVLDVTDVAPVEPLAGAGVAASGIVPLKLFITFVTRDTRAVTTPTNASTTLFIDAQGSFLMLCEDTISPFLAASSSGLTELFDVALETNAIPLGEPAVCPAVTAPVVVNAAVSSDAFALTADDEVS